MPHTIHNIFELANAIGVRSSRPNQQEQVELISRAIYKSTDCGAWVAALDPIDFFVGGVRVGSIVEGCDAETTIHTLAFPFTPEQFWAVVERVDEEAASIKAEWDEQGEVI